MIVYSSYMVKIQASGKALDDTLTCFRHATAFYFRTISSLWNELKDIQGTKKKLNYLEKLTVPTRNHKTPPIPFKGLYDHVPCYLRRCAMAEALGRVVNYQKLLEFWKENGRKPEIIYENFDYPSLYKGNMYLRTGTYTAKIKVYQNGWRWLDVKLKKSDVDYILHHCQDRTECVPKLVKKGKEWFLSFAFEENIELSKDIGSSLMAVDLGINSAAVCSIVTKEGKVLHRAFLSLPKEEDQLKKRIGRIKKAQQNGNYRVQKFWALANGINDRISVLTANFIVEETVRTGQKMIVMEDLSKTGKPGGSYRQRIVLWRRRNIFRMVLDKAHRQGIHVATVPAYGTSKYAYDGSGEAHRDPHNHSISTFPNGKVYNADLNASYNIGARYWIREIEKSISAKKWLEAKAKVPSLSRRSTHTLSSLTSLYSVIGQWPS